MAKKKKKQHVKLGESAQSSCPSAQQSCQRRIPADVLENLGPPVAAALLVDGRILETSRALLSADTMHANTLSTGVPCGIAVADCPASVPSVKQVSGFAPTLDSEDVLTLTPVCVSEAFGAVSNNDIADYLVVGELWPGAKLQKGTIQLSGDLLESMGKPQAGSTILIYKLEFAKESVASKLNLRVSVETMMSDVYKHPLEVSDGDEIKKSSSVASAAQDNAPLEPKQNTEHAVGIRNNQAEWLQDALNKPNTRQAKVLSEVVLRQLNQRWLLQYSNVPITVLGCPVLVQVDATLTSTDPNGHFYFRVIGNSTKVAFQPAHSSSCHSDDAMNTEISQNEKAEAEFLDRVREQALGSLLGSSRDIGADAAVRSAKSGLNSMRKIVHENLGGLSEYQKLLQSLIIMPLKQPEVFQYYGLKPPKGVIFHGPPGTGKTFLACEAARQAGANFFVVNGPDVMSEFYGGSEASLSAVFRAAQACSPSVIFLDEVDALMPTREHNQGI